MEIVNANSATLCNYEVMRHLQKIKDKRQHHKGQLATITYETLRYLENTPCSQETPESITSCIKALKPFNLSKNVLLIIVNTPPTSALEIQLILEESEENLSEEQVDQILEIIRTHLPNTQKAETNCRQKS